jgi:uncharacterized protein YidB (DUF937 family)
MAAIGITQGEAAFRRKSRARSRPSFAARRDEAVWLVSARPRRLRSRMPVGGAVRTNEVLCLDADTWDGRRRYSGPRPSRAVRERRSNGGAVNICTSSASQGTSRADLEPDQCGGVADNDIPMMELKMSRGMPSMTALLGLLAIAGYQNRDKLAELLRGAGGAAPGSSGTSQPLGGLLGNLGGMLGGAGAGGLLSGGIGELLERFNLNGQGETAQSWINSGPNKEISPQQLKQAIGSDVLEKLEQQTGLSQEELLARLSRELPTAVDKYTPDGRLPAA